MKKSYQNYNGKLNPVATAVALVFTGTGSAYAAPEEATLPEVKVSAPEIQNSPETEYKTEKASSSKFTAPLIDTPKSITVIPQSVIHDSGSVTLEDALRTVPGITFGSAEGGGSIGDRPFIRGFDSQASMYVDGIRDVGGQSREIFAIESVEVLKGPSGAFDGRGSAGGSINLVSKLPKAENFVAGSVGLGTDQYRRATGDVNYMLSDDVAVRVNVMGHAADTPGRDEVDVSRWGFAPSITLGMNSPTTATLSYYHLQTDDIPDYGIPYTLVGRSKATPSQPADVNMDNFYGVTNRDYRKTQSDIGTAIIQHAFSDTTVLKNTTRYGTSKNDYIVTVPDDSSGNVANGGVYRSAKTRNSTTDTIANVTDLSVKFDAWKIKHSANIGLELSHEETKNSPYQIIQNGLGFSATGGNLRNCTAGGGLGAALQSNYDCTSLYTPNPNDPWSGSIYSSPVKTTSTATTTSVYAFDSMELSKKWILNLGLRYDSYSTDSDVPTYIRLVPDTSANTAASPGAPGTGAKAIGATVPGVHLQNDSAFFNYQAGVVYKLKPNASVYASFGTSSTPSGTTLGTGSDNLSGGVATNANLDPERSKSYEVGTKWDVLEGLALTGATFYTEKTNARATLADGTTALVGDQVVKGFELGFAGRLTDKWQAFGGYTYLDGKLVDNGTAVANIPNNGNQFPNTPRNSVSLWNTYAVMPDLTIGGGAFYVDKQFGNPANSVVIPSYVRIDAMANYTINKNLNLQLNVQNLTDERYFNAAYTTHYAQVAPGRLAFLTLNFKY